MILKGAKGNYEVDPDAVGKTPIYNLYLCVEVGTGRQCLLQIAIEAVHNGVLDRMAFFVTELAAKAVELEEEYTPQRKFPDERLNLVPAGRRPDVRSPSVFATVLQIEMGSKRRKAKEVEVQTLRWTGIVALLASALFLTYRADAAHVQGEEMEGALLLLGAILVALGGMALLIDTIFKSAQQSKVQE